MALIRVGSRLVRDDREPRSMNWDTRGIHPWGDLGEGLSSWKGISLIQFRADGDGDVDLTMGG